MPSLIMRIGEIQGPGKVVLYGEDIEQLEELQQLAKKKNIVSALVKDAGRTEIPPGTITVLGIAQQSNQK